MPDELQLQDKLCRYRERLLMPVSGQLHMPGAWLGARAVHKGAYQLAIQGQMLHVWLEGDAHTTHRRHIQLGITLSDQRCIINHGPDIVHRGLQLDDGRVELIGHIVGCCDCICGCCHEAHVPRAHPSGQGMLRLLLLLWRIRMTGLAIKLCIRGECFCQSHMWQRQKCQGWMADSCRAGMQHCEMLPRCICQHARG